MSDQKITAEERELAEKIGLAPQPDPIHNDLPSAHDLVIGSIKEHFDLRAEPELTDAALRRMYNDLLEMYVVLSGGARPAIKELRARKEFGLRKYGTPLQPHNGRDQVGDARDEMGDLLVYVVCEIYEGMYPKEGSGE
ncbi:hypothetical protein SEA_REDWATTLEHOG_189 [Gordonia phage RedWattleHog]|uniref:Uncharacterized protein n=1 Tax=Gordonia phage Stormageddon TaxID=2656541 RepID=A0A649VRA2_9CAUD|nr:hypothetical protein KHQ86_gp110 [Gordonia phage Stormageddon]QGJ95050.1 hypothetical protein SEA_STORMAGEDDON_190 [Gordonia phage Stormageddon]QLF83692.1 hypothetical protein SEA_REDWATTLEHOG_189 [Gordonia phage RedWattleHog]